MLIKLLQLKVAINIPTPSAGVNLTFQSTASYSQGSLCTSGGS